MADENLKHYIYIGADIDKQSWGDLKSKVTTFVQDAQAAAEVKIQWGDFTPAKEGKTPLQTAQTYLDNHPVKLSYNGIKKASGFTKPVIPVTALIDKVSPKAGTTLNVLVKASAASFEYTGTAPTVGVNLTPLNLPTFFSAIQTAANSQIISVPIRYVEAKTVKDKPGQAPKPGSSAAGSGSAAMPYAEIRTLAAEISRTIQPIEGTRANQTAGTTASFLPRLDRIVVSLDNSAQAIQRAASALEKAANQKRMDEIRSTGGRVSRSGSGGGDVERVIAQEERLTRRYEKLAEQKLRAAEPTTLSPREANFAYGDADRIARVEQALARSASRTSRSSTDDILSREVDREIEQSLRRGVLDPRGNPYNRDSYALGYTQLGKGVGGYKKEYQEDMGRKQLLGIRLFDRYVDDMGKWLQGAARMNMPQNWQPTWDPKFGNRQRAPQTVIPAGTETVQEQYYQRAGLQLADTFGKVNRAAGNALPLIYSGRDSWMTKGRAWHKYSPTTAAREGVTDSSRIRNWWEQGLVRSHPSPRGGYDPKRAMELLEQYGLGSLTAGTGLHTRVRQTQTRAQTLPFFDDLPIRGQDPYLQQQRRMAALMRQQALLGSVSQEAIDLSLERGKVLGPYSNVQTRRQINLPAGRSVIPAGASLQIMDHIISTYKAVGDEVKKVGRDASIGGAEVYPQAAAERAHKTEAQRAAAEATRKAAADKDFATLNKEYMFMGRGQALAARQKLATDVERAKQVYPRYLDEAFTGQRTSQGRLRMTPSKEAGVPDFMGSYEGKLQEKLESWVSSPRMEGFLKSSLAARAGTSKWYSGFTPGSMDELMPELKKGFVRELMRVTEGGGRIERLTGGPAGTKGMPIGGTGIGTSGSIGKILDQLIDALMKNTRAQDESRTAQEKRLRTLDSIDQATRPGESRSGSIYAGSGGVVTSEEARPLSSKPLSVIGRFVDRFAGLSKQLGDIELMKIQGSRTFIEEESKLRRTQIRIGEVVGEQELVDRRTGKTKGKMQIFGQRPMNEILSDLLHESGHAAYDPTLALKGKDTSRGWRTVAGEMMSDYFQMAAGPVAGRKMGLSPIESNPFTAPSYFRSMTGTDDDWRKSRTLFNRDVSFLTQQGMAIGGKPGISGMDINNVQQIKEFFGWIARFAPQLSALQGGRFGTFGVSPKGQGHFASLYPQEIKDGRIIGPKEAGGVDLSGLSPKSGVSPQKVFADIIRQLAPQLVPPRAVYGTQNYSPVNLGPGDWTGGQGYEANYWRSIKGASAGPLNNVAGLLQSTLSQMLEMAAAEAKPYANRRSTQLLNQKILDTVVDKDSLLAQAEGAFKPATGLRPPGGDSMYRAFGMNLESIMGSASGGGGLDIARMAQLEKLEQKGRLYGDERKELDRFRSTLQQVSETLMTFRRRVENVSGQTTQRLQGYRTLGMEGFQTKLNEEIKAAAQTTSKSGAGGWYGRYVSQLPPKPTDQTIPYDRRPIGMGLGVARYNAVRDPRQHVFGRIGATAENLMSWAVVGRAIYGVQQAVSSLVQTLKAADVQMTQINRILQTSQQELFKLRDGLLEVGVEYARSFEDIADAAEEYAVQGYTGEDLVERAGQAALAMNVSNMSAIETVKLLTAVQSQFMLTDEQAGSLVDKWTAVSQAQRVSFQDVASGAAQVGSLAEEAGFSVDELNALLASSAAVSGETGETVGSALRTIIQRLSVPTAPVRKTFQGVGIDIDSYIGNVPGLMEQIAGQWDTLSEEEKLEVSRAAAEKRRASMFVSMMRAYNEVGKYQRAYTAGLQSEGAAEKANAEIMQAFEKRIAATKIEFQKFAVSLGDAGLLDILKNMFSWAAKFLNVLEKITSWKPVTFLASMAATILLLQKAAKLFGLDIGRVRVKGGGMGGVAPAGLAEEVLESGAGSASGAFDTATQQYSAAITRAIPMTEALAAAILKLAEAEGIATATTASKSGAEAGDVLLGPWRQYGIPKAGGAMSMKGIEQLTGNDIRSLKNEMAAAKKVGDVTRLTQAEDALRGIFVEMEHGIGTAAGAGFADVLEKQGGKEGQALAALMASGGGARAGAGLALRGDYIDKLATAVDNINEAAGKEARGLLERGAKQRLFPELAGITHEQYMEYKEQGLPPKGPGRRQARRALSRGALIESMSAAERAAMDAEIGRGNLNVIPSWAAGRERSVEGLRERTQKLTRWGGWGSLNKQYALAPPVQATGVSSIDKALGRASLSVSKMGLAAGGFLSKIGAVIAGINPLILIFGALAITGAVLVKRWKETAERLQAPHKLGSQYAARYGELQSGALAGTLGTEEKEEFRRLSATLRLMYPGSKMGFVNETTGLSEVDWSFIKDETDKQIENNTWLVQALGSQFAQFLADFKDENSQYWATASGSYEDFGKVISPYGLSASDKLEREEAQRELTLEERTSLIGESGTIAENLRELAAFQGAQGGVSGYANMYSFESFIKDPLGTLEGAIKSGEVQKAREMGIPESEWTPALKQEAIMEEILFEIQKTGLPIESAAVAFAGIFRENFEAMQVQGRFAKDERGEYVRGGFAVEADMKSLITKSFMGIADEVSAAKQVLVDEEATTAFQRLTESIDATIDSFSALRRGLDITPSVSTGPVLGMAVSVSENAYTNVRNDLLGPSMQADFTSAMDALKKWVEDSVSSLNTDYWVNTPMTESANIMDTRATSTGLDARDIMMEINKQDEYDARRVELMRKFNTQWNSIMGDFLEAWNRTLQEAASLVSFQQGLRRYGTSQGSAAMAIYQTVGTGAGVGYAKRARGVVAGDIAQLQENANAALAEGDVHKARANADAMLAAVQELNGIDEAIFNSEQKRAQEAQQLADRKKEIFADWLGNMQSYLSFLTATEQANEEVNYLVLVQLLKLADTPQQKMELERAVFDAEKAVYESRWQNAEAWMSHFKSMEKLNPEQQVPLYQKLLADAKKLGDQAKIWEYEEKLFQAENDLAEARYTRAEKFISHYSAMDMLGPEELVPIYEQLLSDAQKAGDQDKIWEYEEKLYRAKKEMLEAEKGDMAKALFERAAGLSGPAVLGMAEYRAAMGKSGKGKDETDKMKQPVEEMLKYLEEESKDASDAMKDAVAQLTTYLRTETGDITDEIAADWQAAYAKAKIYADAIKTETINRDLLNKAVEFNNGAMVANITKWGELSEKITKMTEEDLVDFQTKMENLFSFAMEYAPLPHSAAVQQSRSDLIARVREIDNSQYPWMTASMKGRIIQGTKNVQSVAGLEMQGALENQRESWAKAIGFYTGEEISKYMFGDPGRDSGNVPSGLPAGSYTMPVPGGRASDTWGASREGGRRSHKGVDIFANKGTPAKALTAGTATPGYDRLGGRIVNLVGLDGSRYYYAHLNTTIARKQQVRYGQWLGGVGNTGNATGGSPHLHLQYRPAWASTWVNPYPYLQRYKVQAATTGRSGTSQFVRHQGGIIGTPDTFTTVLQKGETVVPRSETPVLFGLLDKLDKLVMDARQGPNNSSSNTVDLTINLEMPDGSVRTFKEKSVGISDASLVISRKV